MTTPATQQAPGPGGEAQPAAGFTGEQAHMCEPEPVHEREPEPEPVHEREPAPEPVHEREPEPEPGELGERQPEPLPALALPNLRPYADPKAVLDVTRRGLKVSRRPARSLARRAASAAASAIRHTLAGTAALLRLLGDWLTGEVGKDGSRVARFGGVAAVLAGIAHTLAEHPVETVGGLVLVCQHIGFAHRAGVLDRLIAKARGEKPVEKAPAKATDDAPKPRRKGLAGWLRRKPADTPREEPQQPPAEPPLTALIRELIGDDNGVHLAVLRPAMRERLPGLAEATDQQLRQMLVDAGFDPSRTFRARGVAGRAGIHRSELPPLPSPEGAPGTGENHSPLPESGSDQAFSPSLSGGGERAKSPRKGRQTLPKGWTAEEVARGFRVVDDPDAGPTAARVERIEDAS